MDREPAQPERRGGGFDMGRMSTGTKALFITGILLFISLFLPWQSLEGCDQAAEAIGVSCSVGGFSGLGVLVAILVIALLIWEGVLAAGTNINVGTMSPALISAIIGGAAAVFALIKFLTSLGGGIVFNISWGAFVGLILALALAYASYLRWQESKMAAAPGPPPMG
jgi:hypothetical protein